MRLLLVTGLTAVTLIFSACTTSLDKTNSVKEEIRNPDMGGGRILFYTTDGEFIDAANVGNLPDMVTFTPDGKTVVSANEGEPADDYSSDPEGSISIISLGDSQKTLIQNVTTLFFDNMDIPSDIRIKPGTSPAKDLEPEYIAVNESGTRAWVSLQENNGLAIIDLEKKEILSVTSLGVKDFQYIDMNTKDGANITVAPENVYGLYQPDTIVSYSLNGKDYLVSANEGDDRKYETWEDYAKAKKLYEKGASFSPQLAKDILEVKGRAKVRILKDLGKDANGTYTALYLAGTRSFSIWDTDGKQLYDSGPEFEQELALRYGDYFNTRVDDTDDKEDIAELIKEAVPYEMAEDTAYFWEGIDARSHKKGCEPEALAVAKIGTRVFAYIGLEKQGGFFVYDITNPRQAKLTQYYNNIDYSKMPTASGDLAPEGMVHFVQEDNHYLAIANELSSTVSLYRLQHDGRAAKLSSLQVGSFDSGAAEIIDYDPDGKILFVTNSGKKRVEVIDVANPTQINLEGSINISEHGKDLQSVAVKNGILAIAVERQ